MENRKNTPSKSERLEMVQQIDESTISNEASEEPIRVPPYKLTTEDKIEILNALMKLKEQGKCVDRVPKELYGMMQSSLKDSVTQAQFEDKVNEMLHRFIVSEMLNKLWGKDLKNATQTELEMQQRQTKRAKSFKETIERIIATSKSTTT